MLAGRLLRPSGSLHELKLLRFRLADHPIHEVPSGLLGLENVPLILGILEARGGARDAKLADRALSADVAALVNQILELLNLRFHTAILARW